MTVKKIITGGCSFSDFSSKVTWPYALQQRYPNLSFRHTGMNGQGQELIQKKICLAVHEELQHCKPEELAVIVMWSGTERKTFYVDNSYYIQKIVRIWQNKNMFFSAINQFADLYGKLDPKHMKTAFINNGSAGTFYNSKGGWYICNFLYPDSQIAQEYISTMETSLGSIILSLENIIMCQNFCKVNGVKIYHTFYRDYAYTDLEENKNNVNLNYLYSMLDFDTILTTTGMYEYLRPYEGTSDNLKNMSGLFKNFFNMTIKDETKKYFLDDNVHPNYLGASKWSDEVLIPKLREKGLFL